LADFTVRPSRLFGASVPISTALLFSSQLALAQFSQQAPKLVGRNKKNAIALAAVFFAATVFSNLSRAQNFEQVIAEAYRLKREA